MIPLRAHSSSRALGGRRGLGGEEEEREEAMARGKLGRRAALALAVAGLRSGRPRGSVRVDEQRPEC